MRCDSPHPELDLTCQAPSTHPNHFVHFAIGPASKYLDWPNLAFVPPEPKKKSRSEKKQELQIAGVGMVKLANAINAQPEPAVPQQGTRMAEVLTYLQARAEQWVDGPELASPEVGGSEGLRRVRDLREQGWIIETRQKPGSDAWQYCLRGRSAATAGLIDLS